MAIKQDEKLEIVNKFHVTGKSKALGLLLAELESSIRGKAVHERDETRQDKTYEQDYAVKYEVTNTEEVHRFVQ